MRYENYLLKKCSTTIEGEYLRYCDAPAKWSQHIATLATQLWSVATCCEVLGVLAQIWKWSNFSCNVCGCFMNVVVVWPGSCNNVAPGHAHWFNFQYPTCRNTLQQGGQTRATCCAQQCCVQLFRSFGRSLRMPKLARSKQKKNWRTHYKSFMRLNYVRFWYKYVNYLLYLCFRMCTPSALE